MGLVFSVPSEFSVHINKFILQSATLETSLRYYFSLQSLEGVRELERKLLLGISSSGLEKGCPLWWKLSSQVPSLVLAPRIKVPSNRCEC